ncbi:DUF6197 family protein [Pilimelia columellifera]|uniref:Uncharacterized protein n=1 Tax=Pilimelia columellifera subsp. columellifera TaxID=706583 RepID=A0ABN3MXU0_9ACTN
MNPTQNTTANDRCAGQLLNTAADVIDAHGWTTGNLYDHHTTPVGIPPVCAIGAIYTAAGLDVRTAVDIPAFVNDTIGEFAGWLGTHHHAHSPALRLHLLGGLPDLGTIVADFNDTNGRTATEVVTAMRAAAAAHLRAVHGIEARA